MVGDEAGFLRILRRRASPGDVGVTGGPIGGFISIDEVVGETPPEIIEPLRLLPPVIPDGVNEQVEMFPGANTDEGVAEVEDEDEDDKAATEAKAEAED